MWMFSIAFKEYRVILPLLIGGILLLGMCMINAMGIDLLNGQWGRPGSIPFYTFEIYQMYAFVSVCLAGICGLWQVQSELQGGTWLYLWHRPVSRRKITSAKLASGMILVWVVTGIPLLLYALWAVMPQSVPAPFLWQNTAIYFKCWLGISVMYFAGYLTGMRSGSWLGTRLFPLIPAALLSLFVMMTIHYYWLSIMVIVLFNVICCLAIFRQIEMEDYS